MRMPEGMVRGVFCVKHLDHDPRWSLSSEVKDWKERCTYSSPSLKEGGILASLRLARQAPSSLSSLSPSA
jgi:hypothetical protein